nr:RNA-processing protein, HAT helix [Tanacetum cinerariifolium]
SWTARNSQWTACMHAAQNERIRLRVVVKVLFSEQVKISNTIASSTVKETGESHDKATKAVPASELLSMYEIYIARAAKIYSVSETREIYKQVISYKGLPEKDAMKICIKYAEFEKSHGETDRVRKIYFYASRLADAMFDGDFWKKWHESEVNHGNEDTFRGMLQITRSVFARHSQVKHISLPGLHQ